jgi:nicotinamide-nucleotide amidase
VELASADAGRAVNEEDVASPRVEIVTVGEELLAGDTVDSNAAWLGRTFKAAGIRIVRRATVGDDVAAIRAAVGDALGRVRVVVCTGGLGPTRDDVTLDAVAALTGRPLEEDSALLDGLRRRFAAFGRAMPENNRRQARVPRGADVFPNPRGTAPGLAIPHGDGVIIMLPGVPQEMRALTEASVLPYLARRWPGIAHPDTRLVRTTGIPESTLAERVDDLVADFGGIDVAFLPGWEGVDLRLTAWQGAQQQQLDDAAAALAARLERWVYAVGHESIEEVLAAELVARGRTLALAESCTGGLVAKRLTDLPGSSRYLLGGWVVYANEAKERLLGVPHEVLERHGAVSEETARALAEGALRALGADLAAAITGIAGPTGGSEEKPVGTVWIAAGSADSIRARRVIFPGDRTEVRERSAQAALHMLLRHVRRVDGDDHAD